MKKHCHFCGTEYENACSNCGAYEVSPGKEGLKLEDQDYFDETSIKKKKKEKKKQNDNKKSMP